MGRKAWIQRLSQESTRPRSECTPNMRDEQTRGLMRTERSSMRVDGRFCTASSWRKTGKKSLKNLVNMLKLNCPNGLERGRVKRQGPLTLLKMRMNFLQKLLLRMMMKSLKKRKKRKRKKNKGFRDNNSLPSVKTGCD